MVIGGSTGQPKPVGAGGRARDGRKPVGAGGRARDGPAALVAMLGASGPAKIVTTMMHARNACRPVVMHRGLRHSCPTARCAGRSVEDRKSTRLNSSHLGISYA